MNPQAFRWMIGLTGVMVLSGVNAEAATSVRLSTLSVTEPATQPIASDPPGQHWNTEHDWPDAIAFGLKQDGANVRTVTLRVSSSESYEEVFQQALKAATRAVEQSFASSSASTVTVYVVVDRGGQVAPMLVSRVTRSGWQRLPDIRYWGRSLGRSPRIVLGYNNPLPQQSPITAQRQADLEAEREEIQLENDPAFRDD